MALYPGRLFCVSILGFPISTVLQDGPHGSINNSWVNLGLQASMASMRSWLIRLEALLGPLPHVLGALLTPAFESPKSPAMRWKHVSACARNFADPVGTVSLIDCNWDFQ